MPITTAHRIALQTKPFTLADWDRIQQAKTVLTLRNMARASRTNAEHATQVAVNVMAKREVATTASEIDRLTTLANEFIARRDKFMDSADRDETDADHLERELEA